MLADAIPLPPPRSDVQVTCSGPAGVSSSSNVSVPPETGSISGQPTCEVKLRFCQAAGAVALHFPGPAGTASVSIEIRPDPSCVAKRPVPSTTNVTR